MRNSRGSMLIMEQIFIIIFGIIIFVSVVGVIGSFRRGVSSSVAGSSFEEIGGMVHSAVVDAYLLRNFSTSGRILLELPQKIGNDNYMVYLYQNNITVSSLDNVTLQRTVNIYNIETNLLGNISSTAGGKSYVSYNTTHIYLETRRD
jgi:hypothetical protein